MPSHLDEPVYRENGIDKRPRLDELVSAEHRIQPSPGTEERLWTEIERRLAVAPPASPPAKTPVSLLGKVTPLKALVSLALIAVAGAVPFSLGVQPELTQPAIAMIASTEPAALDAPTTPIASSGSVRAGTAPPAIQPADASAPRIPGAATPTYPSPLSAPSKALRSRSLRRAPTKHQPGEPAVASVPARPADPGIDPFDAELQLIGDIRDALRRDANVDVLQLADEHARRFGTSGQFAPERLVYQIEALCAFGRVDAARHAAAELRESWPRSPHLTRVARTCAGHSE